MSETTLYLALNIPRISRKPFLTFTKRIKSYSFYATGAKNGTALICLLWREITPRHARERRVEGCQRRRSSKDQRLRQLKTIKVTIKCSEVPSNI